MKLTATLLMMTLLLLPAVSDARCRTIGESASIGTEYGTFPLYPAKRIVEAGEKQDSAPLQWVGYGVGLPPLCGRHALRPGRGWRRRHITSLDKMRSARR